MVKNVKSLAKSKQNKSKNLHKNKKKDKNNTYNKKINLSKTEYQWTPWPGLIDD